MPRLTHPEDDRVYACPECDVAGEVYERTHDDKEFDKRCRCHKCGAEFDDPTVRKPKSKAAGGAGVDDDGLPHNLDPAAKRLIRQARGS